MDKERSLENSDNVRKEKAAKGYPVGCPKTGPFQSHLATEHFEPANRKVDRSMLLAILE